MMLSPKLASSVGRSAEGSMSRWSRVADGVFVFGCGSRRCRCGTAGVEQVVRRHGSVRVRFLGRLGESAGRPAARGGAGLRAA